MWVGEIHVASTVLIIHPRLETILPGKARSRTIQTTPPGDTSVADA
jgi:hypothetical protein